MQAVSNAPAGMLCWGQRMNDTTHRPNASGPDRRSVLEMGAAALVGDIGDRGGLIASGRDA